MSEREWEETIVRPPLKITGRMKCMEAKAFDKLTAENAALRAQVERLEAEKLRLREVCVKLNEDGDPDPTLGSYCVRCGKWSNEPPGKRLHHDGCQLAAVLRETDVDTETGRE